MSIKSGGIKAIIVLLAISLLGTGIALYKVFDNKITYRDVEVRATDDYIQYKYKDSEDWNNLVKLETLVGKSGKEVEIKKDGNFVKWKYTDEENWTNLIDLTSLIGQDGKNGTSGKDGREIEVSTNDEYIVYRYKGDKDWTKLVKLSSLKGKDGSDGTNGSNGKDGTNGVDGVNGTNGTDGKEIEITKDDTYIKWRYKGDKNWTNLVELVSLKGKDGKDGADGKNGTDGTNGTNGIDGREVEIENDGTNIKWRYKGDSTWNTLTSLADLKGEKGDKGDKGDAGQDGKNGTDGTNGVDGREVEIENDGTNIKWRYKGDTTWNTLTSLADLKGEKGLDGSEIELVNDGTYIKWRYKDKDSDYTNLIDLETLKGQDGLAWINLGTVDVSQYCLTYNEGETNEHEECGYYEYLKLHFSDAEEGNYTFTDNEDNFIWHIKVESAESVEQKYSLIEYWSTEDSIPNYIQSWYDIKNDKWSYNDLRFISWDELNYYVNNLKEKINSVKDDLDTKYNELKEENNSLKQENESLKSRLEKLEWQDLGEIDTESYCKNDECGSGTFLYYYFLDKDEGNYKYKDSDGIYYHVKLEKYFDGKSAMISFWLDDVYPYYLRCMYDESTDEWTFEELQFPNDDSIVDLYDRNSQLEKRIKALEDYIDELKSQNP